MSKADTMRGPVPIWLLIVAAFGIAWNIFGLIQLSDFVLQTRASLMMKGMSRTAAEVYYGLPMWMTAVFAAGSVGGLAGSVALAVRRSIAVRVLLFSLLGYIALFIGDYAHGVFDVIPGQMAVLSVVVGIAVALLGAGLIARRSQLLA